ncbi:MAG: type II toxin-antitoxin system RelE/ParE family toxin [Streptococcaceae bacterium]|nr:type II toxin-antitoxin system RelE/ParE family toxin [Streptococcaceae bacterium]MCL2680863.1 type II toxin-antitoxin system RelE/ParE family toxin [Streptococcaceae bacterium]MCL2858060.1 type II toxin-antitoxin system RelE/ParE family toxin [Streptococcaceae bacterium]
MSYIVHESQQFRRDTREAVYYKKINGTFKRNIDKFIDSIDKTVLERLKESPGSGSNVAARIDLETKLKYIPIDDYLLFYEIKSKNTVEIVRFLPGKSDWINTLFN